MIYTMHLSDNRRTDMTHISREFDDRIAVVTGAASGIGRATAEMLVARGARVIGLDLSARPEMDGVAWVTADLGVADSVLAAFDQIRRLTDRLDVLVNNAGVGAIGTVEDATEDDWTRVLGVNVLGVARASRHAIPLLRRSDSAAIVNVSSTSALVGTPVRAVYSASKGAVDALTRAMAADLLSERIRVNVVYPGTVETPFTGRLDDDPEEARHLLIERQPLKQLISPSEIAGAVLYLASPHNSTLTGAALRFDGGMTELVNLGTA